MLYFNKNLIPPPPPPRPMRDREREKRREERERERERERPPEKSRVNFFCWKPFPWTHVFLSLFASDIYYIHVYILRQIDYFFMGEWKLFGLTKSVCVANVILSEWCPVTFDQIENNMIKKTTKVVLIKHNFAKAKSTIHTL